MTRMMNKMQRLSNFTSEQSSIHRYGQPFSGMPLRWLSLSCQLSKSGLGRTFDKVTNGETDCSLHYEILNGQERTATNLHRRHSSGRLHPKNLKAWKSNICLSGQGVEQSRHIYRKLSFPPSKRHLTLHPRSSSLFGKACRWGFVPFSRSLSTLKQRASSDRKYSTDKKPDSTSPNEQDQRDPPAELTEPKQYEIFSLTGSNPKGVPETEAELKKRINHIFDKADTNSDGYISREEFQHWYIILSSSGANSSEAPLCNIVEPPTKAQLDAYSWRVMLPFFAFGFIDNFLMIMCGECIDIGLSQKFACSMMISAGLGNAISDAVGVLASDTIDRITGRVDDAMGTALKTPMMTEKQLRLKVVKRRKTIFQTVGIVAGCLVGMFPLIFI